MLFFTSDVHLNHNNILHLANRPFDDIDQMNRRLVSNINSLVGPHDILYFLGDMAFGKDKPETIRWFLDKLNCKDVHLIFGNHDSHDEAFMKSLGFRSAKDYEMFKENKKKFVLSHYPMLDWDGAFHGSYMLHGHIHSNGDTYNKENLENGIKRYDVGVDANNYYPVSLNDIVDFFASLPE